MAGNGKLDEQLGVVVCLNHKPVKIIAVFVEGEWRKPKEHPAMLWLLRGVATYQGLCRECAEKTS